MTKESDRELLEKAARAYWADEIGDTVSIEWSESDGAILYASGENQDHNGRDQAFCWNPLTDDGDAFRLACKLQLIIYTPDEDDPAAVVKTGYGRSQEIFTEEGEDFPAITRRAIVRAAASLLQHPAEKGEANG